MLGAAAAASVSLGAQSPTAPAPKAAARPAKAWTVPHTVDGQPDLTGNWTNATYTPLERPASIGTKEFYTTEEAAAVEKERIAQFNARPPTISTTTTRSGRTRTTKKACRQPAHVARVRSAGRHASAADRGSASPAAAAAGREPRRRTDSIEDRTLAERCITWGNDGPPMMPVGYNANLEILQGPGYVVVRTRDDPQRADDSARRARPHSAEHPPVERRLARPLGRQHARRRDDELQRRDALQELDAEQLKVTERFTRVGPDTINYKFTVDDPTTWTRPWTAEMPLR